MKGSRYIPKFWIAGLLLLLLWPPPVVYLLSMRDSYYDQLVGVYECNPLERCSVDLNSDGVSGKLHLIKNPEVSTGEESAALVEGSKELLRIPFLLLDERLRTHIGITYGPTGRSRLVVFQPAGRGLPSSNAVFIWEEGAVQQVEPSRADEELLRAMAARDGSGTWSQWAFFRFVKLPALYLYYSVLIIVLAFSFPVLAPRFAGRTDRRIL